MPPDKGMTSFFAVLTQTFKRNPQRFPTTVAGIASGKKDLWATGITNPSPSLLKRKYPLAAYTIFWK
jgi:hypothetical protein